MVAVDTGILYWECPRCGEDQKLIAVKEMELPFDLKCDDCEYYFRPLNYEFIPD